jgi:putative transposase
MSYSLDLRKRVLSFIEEGHSKVDGIKIFHVSKRAIFLGAREKKEQGELKLKLRDRKPYKIDDERLFEYLQKNPNHYLKEITASFHVSISAIFYALNRFKKSLPLPRAMRKKT